MAKKAQKNELAVQKNVVVSGIIQYDQEAEEYYLKLDDGNEISTDTNMLFEEIDNLLEKLGEKITQIGDRITIVVERKG